MSFKLGGVSTETLAGVTATLQEWPSLGGLSVESTDKPGGGRYFGSAALMVSQFVFDVMVEGSSFAEVSARRDAFVGLLDPSRGPRPLAVEGETSWVWQDVMVSDEIKWGRAAWIRGTVFRLVGEVTLETQADASAREEWPASVAVDPSVSFTLSTGNSSAYPRLVFPAGGGPWTVTIGGYQLEIDGGIPAGRYVELDWDKMMFSETTAGGARLASLVPRMSRFDRPALVLGQPVTVSVSPAPSAAATFYPNARRI